MAILQSAIPILVGLKSHVKGPDTQFTKIFF